MQIGWNILWFIVGVSLLVTVHEYGHFWVARKLGFKVLRFSVGFGKPLFKRVGAAPDHTEFVIAALPLGGYVRMLDERDGAVAPEDLPRAFASKPPWQRILVLLAGPAANILFAVLMLWAIFWVNGVNHVKAGGRTRWSSARRPPLPACANGDEIRSIDGDPVLDQVDASLGLLDAVSDDGEAVMVVRNRTGAERTCHARDLGSRASPQAHRAVPALSADSDSNTGRRRFRRCSVRSSRAAPRQRPGSWWTTRSSKWTARRSATSASFATTCARVPGRKSSSPCSAPAAS